MISTGETMQYIFANYSTGKQRLRIGNDVLEVHEGKAEVNELNPAQVTLAEIYGGKPVLTTTINEVQPSRSLIDKRSRFVKTIFEQKSILRVALRILNNQVKGVRLGNSSK